MSTTNFSRISKKNIVVLILIFLSLAACKDNFLAESPKDQVSEGQFWKSKDDAQKALVGVYATYYGNNGWTERFQNLDKSMAWMSAFAGYGSWRDFAWARGKELTPISGPISIVWKQLYHQISEENYFLENIDKVKRDKVKKAEMSAEVRFLRAFSYFWLSQTYGNVPIVKKILTFDEANHISQSPKDSVEYFALNELTEITPDLPVERPASEKGRIEKGAALALKGRLLMTQKKWSEAADTYKKIISLGRYSIYPQFKKMFEDGGEDNNEVIFANKYAENEYGELMSQFLMRSSLYGGINSLVIYQQLVDAFLMTDGKTIKKSTLYDPEHPFNNRDPRLYATVLLTGYSKVYGKTYQGDPQSIKKAGQYGPNISGYQMNKLWDRDYEGNLQKYGGDYPQMRYAEVLLGYLESKVKMGGNVDQALLDKTINKLRTRKSVHMPPVTETNPQRLMEIIRRERFVEFAFEGGIRYWDLRRWGRLKDAVNREVYGMKITDDPANYTGNYNIGKNGHLDIGRLYFDDHNYLWPIPLSELDVNPNLKQNPGYR